MEGWEEEEEQGEEEEPQKNRLKEETECLN